MAGAARLLAARGEPADADDLALVVATEGRDGVVVVVDGDRVVSTLTLLDEVVHIGEVAVPAGQVELVATDPDYEGRGLVRWAMEWAHERSRGRRHLLQVMVGIPYFYRQFGYAYATPVPTWGRLDRSPDPDPDLEVRRATLADIPAMDRLQRAAQSGADVWMGHTEACWRWLVEREASEQWLVERVGRPVGVARTTPSEGKPALAELAAVDDAAARTLVSWVVRSTDQPVHVQRRPGTPAAIDAVLQPSEEPAEWYYGRVERLAPLLAHLEPVLFGRLERAGLGDRDHEVLLSTWRQHLRFTIGPSGFQLLAEGGPEQAPVSKGGSGVPPDALAPLLLGPFGAAGLEERLPDCLLGGQRGLMHTLFPPLAADLLTFYLP